MVEKVDRFGSKLFGFGDVRLNARVERGLELRTKGVRDLRATDRRPAGARRLASARGATANRRVPTGGVQ
jgi:hypothetical protein